MNTLVKIVKLFANPNKLVVRLNQFGLHWLFSDALLVKCRYKNIFGKKLDVNNPKTFNEKLQWLKLYDRKPIYTTMVDKYAAKQYIADHIGSEYIIPTLGVWDKFDDIDFESLPNQFVLKCTHDSGGLAICRDKKTFDKQSAKAKIERSLKNNYFWSGREWPYKDVKPRIIAEQYMEDESGELKDYKFMCFNGQVRSIFVCSDRFSERGLHVTFFDREWNVMPFERHYPHRPQGLPKPVNFEKMIELAETLSKDITFVRVDFYEVKGKIYFGELTFFPGSGLEEFTPEEWDYTFGKWIALPVDKQKIWVN